MKFVTERNRKWWGLAALVPAVAMIFTDQTILPVALPNIRVVLSAGEVALQWTVNAYLLVIAVLVLAGGKIGDLFGYRRIFTLGMILFAAASALCGFSPNIHWLIGARAIQGVGAALMFPASTALLMTLFPANERGKAAGINVSVSSLFLILGPLIGGYFVENYSWRWIFWVNLPLAVLGVLLVYLFIPVSSKGKGKIDLLGFISFAISSTCFVTAFMQGGEWGWASAPILSLFGICALSGIFLFWREKKADHPFLDLSLFKHPVYKAVNISVFATQFILMITVFRAIFFQEALDWSPMKTGFITFLSCLPVLFMSLIGGFLSDRYGPKLPIAIGYACLIFSFFWLSIFIQSQIGMVLLGLCAMGFGIPLILTPSYASAMGAVPPTKAGAAFGTISTVRTLGSAIGVAMIGSFIYNVQFSSFKRNLRGGSLQPEEIKEIIAGGAAGREALQSLPSDLSQKAAAALQLAKLEGFYYSHIILGFALIVSFFFVFVLYHRKSAHRFPEAPAEGWD